MLGSTNGTQAPTQAFVGGRHRRGSRVASYSATFVEDTPSSSIQTEKLESISAIPLYKHKSHEELRWEYYELGNKDIGTSGLNIFTLESILAMPVYKDKSHEELRWEDYHLGDKGGPISSDVQSTGMGGFNSSRIQTDAFSPSPAFDQSSANPFSRTSTTPNSNNPFAPKTSKFSSGFGRHLMVSLAILTGTMVATVVVSRWSSLRFRKA